MPASIPVAYPQIRQQLKLAALITASLISAYLCYKVLQPFFPALVWAVALAIVARPLHVRLVRRMKNRTVTALICVVVATLALIIPLVLVTQQVISQATAVVQKVSTPEFRDVVAAKVDSTMARHPKLGPLLKQAQERIDLIGQAQRLAVTAGTKLPAFFVGSVAGVAQLFVALFTMFFLLRDSEYFMGGVRCLVPLNARDTNEVLRRVEQTIDASVRGRVVIAAIQGTLGGLMFWWLGLPGPVLWGAVMAVISVVPLLGAFLVWIPAALFLLISGSAAKAIILTVWGALVIGSADNFLYPILVGKDLQLRTITIFFSVLGGVSAFGAAGLVIGPVIFAITDALFVIWNRREAVKPVSQPPRWEPEDTRRTA